MFTPRVAGMSRCCLLRREIEAAAGDWTYASHSSVGIGRERCRRICAGLFLAGLIVVGSTMPAFAQKKRVPPGGHVAVVADERLAALRVGPMLSARLIRRLGRGTLVSVREARLTREGVVFSRVVVTRRTSGWLPSAALIASGRSGDDRRLAHLIDGTDEFERVARARIFLDTFARSPLRARVLLALGDAAEAAAQQLSREATRRFERREIPTDGAPEFSYYLNYNGLDRYNRQGVVFSFDRATKQFHYDGAAWREIIRKYPNSAEAIVANSRLDKLLTKAQ